jgi:sugar-specific transcriptional regulator TrmB
MDEEIRNALRNMELEELEITIYLFLLQKGASTQQNIAEKTGLLRQTIYDRIRRLESKGIVSRTNDESKPLFLAVPPKVFLEQIKEKEQQIKAILPALDELRLLSENQITSTTFTGLKALKKLMQLTLTDKEEICWIANKEISDKIFSEHFWFNYSARRVEKDIPIKLLIEPTKNVGWKTNRREKRFTKMHTFVKDKKSSIIVFGDQIVLYSAIEESCNGTHIQDKNLAQLMREFFDKLWKEGKEL